MSSKKETVPVTLRDIFLELMEKAKKDVFFQNCSCARIEINSNADKPIIAVLINLSFYADSVFSGNRFRGYGIITEESANRASIRTDNIALINYSELWELFETYSIEYADLTFRPYAISLQAEPYSGVVWVDGKQGLFELLSYDVRKFRDKLEQQNNQRQENVENATLA